ncbi:MAG: phage antirepressor KilAC domain-containing protein [Lysobacterales bacterium]
MKNLIPMQFENESVRVHADSSGELLFVGRDVATVLGYADATNAMKQHCRGVVKRHPIIDSRGRAQEARMLAEPDVLRLIVSSKLPAAERFERWVFEEALPSIRKSGGNGDRVDVGAVTRAQLAQMVLDSENEKLALEARVATLQVKADRYQCFLESDGLYGLNNSARALGVAPRAFTNWLRSEGYLFHEGGALVPRAVHRGRGYFIVKTRLVDNVARPQTYITPKGLDYFARKIAQADHFQLSAPDRNRVPR